MAGIPGSPRWSALRSLVGRIVLERLSDEPAVPGRDVASRQIAAGPDPREPALASRLAERDALERAFDRLSADERTLLVLHHHEARPLTEIAALLDVRVGTVKSRLHAARRALERALEVESR